MLAAHKYIQTPHNRLTQTGAPTLCFAGEATSRAHTGTVHGAYLSGQREVRRLLAAWGLSKQ